MTLLKNALSRDVIEVEQQFYIRASSSLADDRTRVLLNEHVDLNYLYDSFAPRLEKYGFGEQELTTVLVDNPRRLLAFPVADN